MSRACNAGAVDSAAPFFKKELEMKSWIKKFVADDSGLETVEYAVMTALIVGAMVVAITALSGAVTTRFGATQTVIDGIDPAPATP